MRYDFRGLGRPRI